MKQSATHRYRRLTVLGVTAALSEEDLVTGLDPPERSSRHPIQHPGVPTDGGRNGGATPWPTRTPRSFTHDAGTIASP